MPKRLTATRKVKTDEVQSKGSWVLFKAVTWGETTKLAATPDDIEPENAAGNILTFLTEKVLDWNWVDEEGEALLLPISGDGWMDALTKEEVTYLMDKATD